MIVVSKHVCASDVNICNDTNTYMHTHGYQLCIYICVPVMHTSAMLDGCTYTHAEVAPSPSYGAPLHPLKLSSNYNNEKRL